MSCFAIVRNFGAQTATAENPGTEHLSGGNGSDSLTFGRRRRLLVLSSAVLNAVFWFLYVVIVLLPERLASEAVARSHGDNYFLEDAICPNRWIDISVFMSIYQISFVIRAIAFPICSMLATRSIEFGSKLRKIDNAFNTMRTQVVYKEDGTASYRLNSIESSGPCTRFSADDWHVAVQ
jgi:hypothetical protein